MSEPLTSQESYRLREQLDHDMNIGVDADDMTIFVEENTSLDPKSLDMHTASLRKRLIAALEYDSNMSSLIG